MKPPRAVLLAGLAVALLSPLSSSQAETTLSLWSHWADQDTKRAYIEGAARAFEQANEGVKVEVTWYDKQPLYAALKTALRAGQAPDIFYAEPDQKEYMENGLILDLTDKLNWDNLEGWARDVWSHEGRAYGLPLEAWTVEMYYDAARLSSLGAVLPETMQFGQEAFVDLVEKSAQSGVTPISLGVGDRPYPGAFLSHEALLKMLGVEDYARLLSGEMDWNDPRVKTALGFVKSMIDAGALPNTFSTLKLGESHYYFHTKPGALTFLMGSFYPSRAFQSPDKGGQPEGFELGIMKYPALEGAACNECKTIAVGGSYVVNATSKSPDLAVAFLNSLATPEMGNKWLEENLVQTGIKSDVSSITGDNATYFRALAAVNEGAQYFFGLPRQVMQPAPREVFDQVINQAFPAGLVDVDEVVEQMSGAY